MIRIGTVWDRTTEVLSGRGGMLAGIAALTLVLPSAIRDAVTLLVVPGAGPAVAAIGGLVSLLTLVAMVFGQLAITAAALDPKTLRGDAFAIAGRRLGAAIGIYLILGLAAIVALLPVVVILIGAGLDPTQLAAGVPPTIAPGTILALGVYFLAFLILALWLSARFFVLNPVIVAERLGLGSIRRSFALTKGSTWRLIGFILLAAIVLGVAVVAAQAVSGLVFRLILGADRVPLVAWLAAVVGSLVTAAYTVVVATFAAQFYVAARGSDYGDVFA